MISVRVQLNASNHEPEMTNGSLIKTQATTSDFTFAPKGEMPGFDLDLNLFHKLINILEELKQEE